MTKNPSHRALGMMRCFRPFPPGPGLRNRFAPGPYLPAPVFDS